jgi:hypothetical protein
VSTQTDLDWYLGLVDDLKWQFAKTMKDSPHSYVVRGKQLGDEDFERAVRVIRTFGEPGKFWSKTHIYLTHGDRKWWTMGYPVWQTKIINVADTKQVYGPQDAPRTYTGIRDGWDAKATTYDEEFAYAEETKAVQSAIISMVGAFAPKTLDIGCGTGRSIDMGIVPNSMLTAIDSSQAMLNEFVRKVNLTKKAMPDIRPGRAEDVEFGPAYDLGLALFGSASEVEESVIDRMAACCSNLVLMPYTDSPEADFCRSLDGAVVRRVGLFDLITVKG